MAKTNPDTSFILRVLSGKLSKSFDIKTLPDQIAKTFSSQKPGSTITSKKVITVGKYKAVQILYSFQGDDYSMSVLPTPSKTFYMTFWAKQGELANSGIEINQINSAVASYAASHQ
jgi:hypothetical protein